MNITLLCIGHMKDKALASLQTEYVKRLSAFCHVEIVEVKDEANRRPDRPAQARIIKDMEAQRVLERIRPTDLVVLLDLQGTEWTSEQFSKKLDGWRQSSHVLTFVIAGSLGPGDALLQRADVRWKLSELTFTHLMARVLVLEQIYRGFMIAEGRTYHK